MANLNGKSKMITCRHCGARIAAGAKICPQCGGKNKKPFYKRIWFWVLIALVLIGGMGAGGGSSDRTGAEPAAAAEKTESGETQAQTAEEKAPEKKEEEVIEYTACSVSKMMEDLNANAVNHPTHSF